MTDLPLASDSRTRDAGRARSKRGLRATAGFTIVEVAAAAFVMFLALSSCLLVLERGCHGVDSARNSTLAAQFMQCEVERIRLMSWADINDPAKLPWNAPVDLTSYATAHPETANRFTMTRTVTAYPGRTTSMVTLTMNISWKNSDGTTGNRSMSTRYSKNGLYDFYYTIAH
jgi:Tfp pilus assembly protein PilV